MPIRGNSCGKCGKPLISEQQFCMRCREREFYFCNNNSIFEYTGAVQELIKKYKFGKYRVLAAFFAKYLADFLKGIEKPFCIVPVPGNPAAIQRRGWDQVAEITKLLITNFGFSAADILSRKKSRQQKSLNFVQRSENLKGKINVKRKKTPSSAAEIILIDDVFTTGATVSECARVLKEYCGEERDIRVLTIAID